MKLIYHVKLDADDYAQLMALVMVYGTGTGGGDDTLSVGARKALGRPEITADVTTADVAQALQPTKPSTTIHVSGDFTAAKPEDIPLNLQPLHPKFRIRK